MNQFLPRRTETETVEVRIHNHFYQGNRHIVDQSKEILFTMVKTGMSALISLDSFIATCNFLKLNNYRFYKLWGLEIVFAEKN